MVGMKALLRASAAIGVVLATPVAAQETATGGEPTDAQAQESAADIIVNGNIAFRNRTEDPNPVLSYDLEYFQRFEPVSVGEMLKRVPGVTFASDVLEYDGVQMRGLPSGFTKILINGKRAPGGEADRSFFVDRIPAELVERIEIVRSPTADQSSEGVAGTLNIITKDSAQFDGGFAKVGALMNSDGVFRPSGALAYADTLSDGVSSFWGALNYQQRRNPKKKTSERYDEDLFFNDRELQDDTRDGTDISGNAEFRTQFGDGGNFRIRGLFIDTDRDEDETSLTYEMIEDPEDFGELYSPTQDELELDGVEIQQERISQQTYAITADAEIPIGPGELGLQGAWNGFREDTLIDTIEGDTIEEAELDSREFLKTHDDEYEATVYYRFKSDTFSAKLGIDYLNKSRDGSLLEEGEEDEPGAGSIYEVKEKRYDPYLRLTFEPTDALTIDAGLRYEITRRETRTNEDEAVALTRSAKYDEESLNPSISLRYQLGDGQFRASAARTIRRPDYDLISPLRQEEEPTDENVLVGNPFLRNQKSWGVDVGYEQRFGRNGIFGINFFYRDITDLIELESTGAVDEDTGFDIVSPTNIGDGETWGVEVDLSVPLTFAGLPDTGIFANYTYLDSSLTDPFTGEERRFDNQPHHLYNAGFIHTVRPVDASFGVSVSGRSGATESNFDETIDLRYDPDLEAFVEKRFGKSFVLRVSAQNLLNRRKKEDFLKYDGDTLEEILENRANGEFDEYEIEREKSGPLFQVTLRAAF